MRRELLSPPRPVTGGSSGARSANAVAVAPPDPTVPPPRADPLPRPVRARQRARRWFDPATGWFRRIERETSLWLSRNVYPHIPGLSLPYDWALRHRLTLSEADVFLRNLPLPFDGFRVLLLSDLHVGPFVTPAVMRETLERFLALDPDAVVIAGDITTSRYEEYESHRDALAILEAPHGVFAVLGNHDHYTEQTRRLSAELEQTGIQVLTNSSVDLKLRDSRLSLAGVDDLVLGEPDLTEALRGVRDPVILISHNPDLFFDAAEQGVALVLSGHTHAGQIRVPGFPVIVRQSRYRLDEGRYRWGDSELVVSRGIGAVGLPLRAFCPPEGVLLTLRSRE